MTPRQKILKAIYPIIIAGNKFTSKNNKVYFNKQHIKPYNAIYDIEFILNNDATINLSLYKGRKILIANTASDCGYTNQYEDLQKLYEQYKIMIIAFPSNDFKEQEKGSDKEIAQFCKTTYGVTFPIAKKSVVIKNAAQHKIYQWLSDTTKNGWLDNAPVWNFCKYLINEEGTLTHYFEPGVEPLSNEVIDAIQS